MDFNSEAWEKKYNKLASNHSALAKRLIEAERGIPQESSEEWKEAYTEISTKNSSDRQSFQKKIEEIQKSLDETRKYNTTLSKELGMIKASDLSSVSEDTWRGKYSRLASESNSLNEQVTAYKKELESLQNKYGILVTKDKKLNPTITSQEQEIQNLKTKLLSLNSEHSKLENVTNITDKKQTVTILQLQNKNISLSKTELTQSTKLSELIKQCTMLQTRNEHLEADKKEYQPIINTLEQTKTKLERELNTLSGLSKDKIKELTLKESSTMSLYVQEKAKVSNIANIKQENKIKIESLSSDLKDTKSLLERIQIKYNDLDVFSISYKPTLARLDDEVKALEMENRMLSRDVDTISSSAAATNQKLIQKVNELSNENRHLIKKIQEESNNFVKTIEERVSENMVLKNRLQEEGVLNITNTTLVSRLRKDLSIVMQRYKKARRESPVTEYNSVLNELEKLKLEKIKVEHTLASVKTESNKENTKILSDIDILQRTVLQEQSKYAELNSVKIDVTNRITRAERITTSYQNKYNKIMGVLHSALNTIISLNARPHRPGIVEAEVTKAIKKLESIQNVKVE